MKDLIIVGIQGSGKGTQGKIVAEKFGFQILETGQFFRNLKSDDSPLARKVAKIIDAGDLVPDDIVMEIVENLMNGLDATKPILFDGVPRTEAQRVVFEALLAKNERCFHVVSINISEEEAFIRLMKRAKEEGRADDTPTGILERIELFYDRTKPMVESWRSAERVAEVDGMGSVEEISEYIFKIVENADRCGNCTCSGEVLDL